MISYFGEFGKLDGWISESVKGGFLFELAVTRAIREQLASKMSWLDKQHAKRWSTPARRSASFRRTLTPSLFSRTARTETCLIIDMSASGVAVSAETQPPIGMPLAVGRTVGRVVRHFREGFAVKFVEVQERERLESLLIRA